MNFLQIDSNIVNRELSLETFLSTRTSNSRGETGSTHIVLLGGKRARNKEFDYDRSEFADMDNSQCNANYILKI